MIRKRSEHPATSQGPRPGLLAALILSLVLGAACAVVEPPPGGPVDVTPPELVVMEPDSGAIGVGELKTIRLRFSEKMDRVSAVTWLHFFPDQRIRQTKWHGATEAEVILENTLPPDTVIVLEVAAGMRDAHKVKSDKSRRFPISTGGEIPAGIIEGVLIMADSAVTNGVLELYEIPPDTLEYFQQPILRRTVTDRTGKYRFDWLPVPGGPWLVRAYSDPDNNLRPGERDAQRLVPDTLRLSAEVPAANSGVTTLYAWNTPGRVLVGPFDPPLHEGEIMVWTMAVTEEDTGWVPAPESGQAVTFSRLDPSTGGLITEVKPGLSRAVMFVDVDGDSTFSGVPDSLLGVIPDSVAAAVPDTVETAWYLEPWFMFEGIVVEPGLDAEFVLPPVHYSLTPWTAPAPAVPDSLAGALEDSLRIETENE